MAEIVNRSSSDPSHACVSELPGKRVYSTIHPERRQGIARWTVARCSCGELWTAWPCYGDIAWRRSHIWAKIRYRSKSQEA